MSDNHTWVWIWRKWYQMCFCKNFWWYKLVFCILGASCLSSLRTGKNFDRHGLRDWRFQSWSGWQNNNNIGNDFQSQNQLYIHKCPFVWHRNSSTAGNYNPLSFILQPSSFYIHLSFILWLLSFSAWYSISRNIDKSYLVSWFPIKIH